MDHAANDVLRPIIICSNNQNIRHFLDLVCRAKGRSRVHVVDTEDATTLPQPTLVDHGLPIHGLHHILTYLEDQYPEPPLCFDTPDRRVIVRMAVEEIVNDLYASEPDCQHPTLLALAQELGTKRFVMDRLSMIDLALVPVAPPGVPWDRHRKAVAKAIDSS